MDYNTKLKPSEVDTPSKLIVLALQDLELARATGFEIDLDKAWVTRSLDGKVCTVCLAGAMLVRHFDDRDLPFSEFSNEYFLDLESTDSDLKIGEFSVKNACYALNSFRKGSVNSGLRVLGRPPITFNQYIAPYEEDPQQFKADMLELAAKLEAKGL